MEEDKPKERKREGEKEGERERERERGGERKYIKTQHHAVTYSIFWRIAVRESGFSLW